MFKSKELYSRTILLIWIIAIIALFMHGKIPYMLPLSVLSTTFVGICLIWLYRKNLSELKHTILGFANHSWTYILLGLIFVIAVILTRDRDPLELKESLYFFYIWALIAELYLIKEKIIHFNFQNYFNRGYLFFLFILLFGFYYSLLTSGNWFEKIFGFSTDYNYLALGFLIAVPIIIYEWVKIRGFWKNLLGALFLLSVFIPVFASGSRRGLVLALAMHIGILIYLFTNFRSKEKSRLLIHYFSILLLSLTVIIISFGTAAPQVRNLLVNTYFPNSEQKVKTQITSISFRYSTIRNDTLTRSELYDKLWKSVPFQAEGLGSRLIKNYLKSKLNKFLEYKEYAHAWITFIELRSFCTNKEAFLEIIPAEYKRQIPEDFVLSDSLILSPYTYPIPFLEKDFIDFSDTHNVQLLSSESNSSDQILSFESLKEGDIFLKSDFVFVPQTENTISLDYKGISANKLKINFFDDENNEIFLKEKSIDRVLANGFIQRQISFLTPFDYPIIGKIMISTNSSNEVVFEIGKNEHLRIPYILKNEGLQDIQGNVDTNKSTKKELQFSGDILSYLSMKESRNIRLNDLHKKRITEVLPLTNLQQDSLRQFIDQEKAHLIKFINYGPNSTLLLDNKNKQIFSVPVNGIYTRAYAVIPAIINLEVNFECKFIGNSKPLVYIKRSPEINPYNFSLVMDKTEITKLGDSTYLVKYKFQVRESNSGIGIIVIGYQNALKNEKFSIADAQYTFSKINNKALQLNSSQYNFLKRLIVSEHTAQTNSEIGFTNTEIIQWRDSLSSNNNLLESRLQRWKFSVYYFNQYNLIKKLFGNGFTYLKVFPLVFLENRTNAQPDYPHNPIISAFLYSGILGGFFYIYFLGLSFYRYWRLRKELALLGMIYALTFSFTFFSGNSHFTVPAFTLLSIIPFAFKIKKPIIRHKLKVI